MDYLKLTIYFFLVSFVFLPFKVNAMINGNVTSAAAASAGRVSAVVAGQLEFQKLLSRTVTISAESANGAMLRRIAAGTPAGLLLLAGMAAYNYYFDAGTGKLKKRGNLPAGNMGCDYGTGANTLSLCITAFEGNSFVVDAVNQAANSCVIKVDGHNKANSATTFAGVRIGYLTSCTVPSSPQVYQKDGDLTQDEMTNYRESQSKVSPQQILTNNGVADRQVPEIANALDDMEQDYIDANDLNADGSPNTATQPDTDPATGDTGLDSFTTDAASTAQTDCDKYPNALGCVPVDRILDAPVDPGPLDLVVQDVPVTFSPTLSYEGSCPALQPISIKGHSISLSTAPMCEFAVSIKPIVLALASLIAAGIVMGLNKTNDQ